jgi:copper chaperone CopZ
MSLLFRRSVLFLALMPLVAVCTTVQAGNQERQTVVTVSEMCGGCVKNITTRLQKVSDVEKIECDIATKTVTITPKSDKTLSPKFIWETMAEIGKTPTKLVAPSGSFTAKPNK